MSWVSGMPSISEAVAPEQLGIGVESVGGHRGRIGRAHDLIGAEPPGVLGLGR